jgi:ABC-type antimicrobial peptide transport system permease subunit
VFLRVPAADVSRAAKAVSRLMTERGKPVVTLYPVVFSVLLGSEVERFRAVDAALFLACLAMGGVVMANLGLLTVLRRTREIALRRVEGATRRDVAAHFLLEGLLLSAFGCALGLAFGMALAGLRASLEPVTGFTWAFPLLEGSVAVLAALAIGVLASALPAIRAARQDPVAGLVDE